MNAAPETVSSVPPEVPLSPPRFSEVLLSDFVHRLGMQGLLPQPQPAIEALVGACDVVLLESVYGGAAVVCLVDAEGRPEKRFGLDAKALTAARKALAKLLGGVALQVIEVRDAVTGADRTRLKALRSATSSAFAVDLSRREVFAATQTVLDGRGRLLRKLLQGPRSIATVTPAALPEAQTFPYLTAGLLVLMVGIFALECFLQTGSSLLAPDVGTLDAMGGLFGPRVTDEHQWYRLFTAMFLHAGVLHILMNAVALFLAGALLEHLLGRAWLATLFFLGGLGGSLMSLWVNPPDMVSVGASGAIMGLLAASLIVAQRLPPGATRQSAQKNILGILIPSLLPVATVRTGEHIDFGAHLGGALVGAIVGGLVYVTWSREDVRPRFPAVPKVVAALGVLVLGWSAAQAVEGYGNARLVDQLIPQAQLPHGDVKLAKAQELVKRFPRDPRAHLILGAASSDAGDSVSAEKEARAGLAEKTLLDRAFKPGLRLALVDLLVTSLKGQGREAQARAEVAPFCAQKAELSAETAAYCDTP